MTCQKCCIDLLNQEVKVMKIKDLTREQIEKQKHAKPGKKNLHF